MPKKMKVSLDRDKLKDLFYEKEVIYFRARLKEYGFLVSNIGYFIDKETNKKVHLNHIVCLIRNDYLNDHPGCPWNISIDKKLKAFIASVGILLTSACNSEKYEHLGKDVLIKDSFL